MNSGGNGGDLNANHRLQHVLGIDDTDVLGIRGVGSHPNGLNERPEALTARRENGKNDPSERRLQLERLCFKAERDGCLQTWAKALPLLAQHLIEVPRDAQALAQLARAHAALGNRSEAVRAAQQALIFDNELVLGHTISLLMSESYAESGNFELAVKYAETALASRPGDADAIEALVTALASMRELSRAEAALGIMAQANAERAASLARSLAGSSGCSLADRHWWLSRAVGFVKSLRSFKELGEVCLALRRDQEAKQWLQKAFSQLGGAADADLAQMLAHLQVRAGCIDEALETYQISLSASSDGFVLHRCYGQLLLAEGRASEAIDVLRRGAKQAPPEDAASIYVYLADLHQSMGQACDAKRSFEAAVDADANSLHAWHGLLLLSKIRGNVQERLSALRNLVRLEPQTVEWHVQLGVTFLEMPPSARSDKDVSRHFQEALRQQPGNVTALLGLARLSQERATTQGARDESQKEALHFFEQAAKADPTNEEALEGAGNATWVRGDFAGSAAWYRQLLKRQPGRVDALCRVAVTCLWCGDAAEAVTVLQHAVRSCSDSYEALALLGYAYISAGKPEESIWPLQAAVRIQPEGKSVVARLYLALGFAHRGNELGAAAELEAAATCFQDLRHISLVCKSVSDEPVQGGDGCLRTALPGKEPQVRRFLSILSRLVEARAAAPAAASTAAPAKSGGAAESVADVAPKGWAVTPHPQSSGTVPGHPPSSNWRDELYEGQEIEVYSKSGSSWIGASIASLRPDVVKVKYLVNGSWCEKALLRNSDSLRPRIGQGDNGPPADLGLAVAAPFAPPPRQAPSRAGEHIEEPSPIPQAATSAHPMAKPAVAVAEVGGQLSGPADRGSCRALSARSSPSAEVKEEDQPLRRQWVPADNRAQLQARGPPPSSGSGTPASSPGHAAVAGARRQWLGSAAAKEAPAGCGCAGAPATTPGASSYGAQASLEFLLNLDDLYFGQVLGTGGFGAVYRGTFRGDAVAIKKLHPIDGQVTPMQIEEFSKEVANLQALRHPRLVNFIGAAFSSPNLCIVTEFMPNGSLYELLHQRKQAISTTQRVSISTQIAEGVAFLHEQSPPFVHRDLKSMNVVLDFLLNVKLCDFGLTQSMEKTHISRRDNEGGSPRYMAPELFDCRGKITEKVDIWALGCLALEVVSGRMPHEECTSIQQVMTKTLVERQPPFRDLSGVAPELKYLVERCLEFEPQHRLDAVRFLNELRAVPLWGAAA